MGENRAWNKGRGTGRQNTRAREKGRTWNEGITRERERRGLLTCFLQLTKEELLCVLSGEEMDQSGVRFQTNVPQHSIQKRLIRASIRCSIYWPIIWVRAALKSSVATVTQFFECILKICSTGKEDGTVTMYSTIIHWHVGHIPWDQKLWVGIYCAQTRDMDTGMIMDLKTSHFEGEIGGRVRHLLTRCFSQLQQQTQTHFTERAPMRLGGGGPIRDCYSARDRHAIA